MLKEAVRMGKTFKIVMIRHGESEWNKENKFCGWYDAGLSEVGEDRPPLPLPREVKVVVRPSLRAEAAWLAPGEHWPPPWPPSWRSPGL